MADGSVAQPLPGRTRAPRSIDFTMEDRDLAVAVILGGLVRGKSLAEICAAPGMPSYDTVYEWQKADAVLDQAVIRARERGYEQIALDTLAISDGLKPVVTADGIVLQPDTQRDKLRADVRFRLLAKLDPKRFGEAVQMRMADANGEKLDTTPMIRELLALVRPADGSQAIDVTPTKKEPPAG